MKVSCICVSSAGAIDLARRCFEHQTHRDAELVVVHELDEPPARDTDRVRWVKSQHPPERKLGDLYNVGVNAAAGDCCAIWDSDDWHGPNRIAHQLAEHLRTGSPVVLSRWHMFDAVHRLAYLGFHRTWEASLFTKTDTLRAHPYPSTSGTKMDTRLMLELLTSVGLSLLDSPEDYIYVAHQGNTMGRAHMERLLARSTRLGPAEDKLFAERLGL